MTDLLAHVERSIRAQKLLPRGRAALLAVSGGLDSMVLLHLLHQLAGNYRWKLMVAHFNHRLRGRRSDGDEHFVRKAAAALGLQFVAGRGSVKTYAQKSIQSLEMAARNLRHAFLARTALERKCGVVALAHHADDQVELFFLRLFRGAGSDGLAGMKWCAPSPTGLRVQLIRPLLDVRRSDLASFAHENRIPFREDASNASLTYRRNRIRHELLPRLESGFQPGVAKTILRSMDILGAEAEFVAEAAGRWLAAKRRPAFDTLPLAVQRRCLQIQLQKLGVAGDFQMIEWLRENPNRSVNINAAASVIRDTAGWVRVRTEKATEFQSDELGVPLNESKGDAAFSGLGFRWRIVASRSAMSRSRQKQCECFDADKVGAAIILRHWRPGDRFQPIGMPRPVKLQDWFTNCKVPATRRRELVVAATAAGEIFWVEGQRISEPFKLTQSTQRRLIWLWQKA